MALPSSKLNDWSLIISRVLFGGAVIIGSIVLLNLAATVDDQAAERRCAFALTTETDRVDSDIAVKQAQIFEAAILRPSTGDTTTPELNRLATELQVLIRDREVAYEERDSATERCA